MAKMRVYLTTEVHHCVEVDAETVNEAIEKARNSEFSETATNRDDEWEEYRVEDAKTDEVLWEDSDACMPAKDAVSGSAPASAPEIEQPIKEFMDKFGRSCFSGKNLPIWYVDKTRRFREADYGAMVKAYFDGLKFCVVFRFNGTVESFVTGFDAAFDSENILGRMVACYDRKSGNKTIGKKFRDATQTERRRMKEFFKSTFGHSPKADEVSLRPAIARVSGSGGHPI